MITPLTALAIRRRPPVNSAALPPAGPPLALLRIVDTAGVAVALLLALELLHLVPARAAEEDVFGVDERLGPARVAAFAHLAPAVKVGAAQVETVNVRGNYCGKEEEATFRQHGCGSRLQWRCRWFDERGTLTLDLRIYEGVDAEAGQENDGERREEDVGEGDEDAVADGHDCRPSFPIARELSRTAGRERRLACDDRECLARARS